MYRYNVNIVYWKVETEWLRATFRSMGPTMYSRSKLFPFNTKLQNNKQVLITRITKGEKTMSNKAKKKPFWDRVS